MATIVQQKISDIDLTEIINGEEIMSPSPLSSHQEILLELTSSMRNFVKSKNLGKVFISPLDVIFEEGKNRLQPDLIFIRKQNLGIVQDWIRGVPDLVVEIVSQGSVTLDTVTKKAIYETYGVGEYWIVFPEFACIEVFTLSGNRYELFASKEGEGSVTSKMLKGFEVHLKEVFENVNS
ncbi:MAG: Uma2 family endonuclease [Calditrichae bacterium]|nr:Uma2 family endonuclease [Calditrichia bacterium]